MKRVVFSLAALSLLLPLGAKDNPAPLSPGRYEDWGEHMDQLEIVRTFKLADYKRIQIEPVDTASTPLPKEGDKRRAFVKNVLGNAQTLVLEGVRAGAGPVMQVENGTASTADTRPVSPPPAVAAVAPTPSSAPAPAASSADAPAAAADPPALILRLKVVELNPGSKAARFWGGFGTGHSDAVLSGELIDASSGTVLLRFQNGRGSSATMSISGGNYEALMTRDLRDASEDVGKMIAKFK